MMTTIAWFPWWAQLLAGVILLGLGVAYLLMPFSVFGVKPRLEEIELQLGEIRAELRVIAMRLSGDDVPRPARPTEFAPPPQPAPASPASVAPVQGPAPMGPSRPHVEPSAEPLRADPRVARASDDWAAPHDAGSRSVPPRVAPVRLNDPWAPAARAEPERPRTAPPSERDPYDRPQTGRSGSFLASESEAGPRLSPTVAADRPYDDMPPEGIARALRPTHFEPPPQDMRRPPVHPVAQQAPQTPPAPDQGGTDRGYYAPPAAPAGEAPWRRREELSPRAADERPARDEDDTWRRPRSEPTLRWPPKT